MKPALFCSILLAFSFFACKPKPLDNLKEVARQVEENKVQRVTRDQLAHETQRVADSLLTQMRLSAQHKESTANVKADLSCDFSGSEPYQQFREKYKGRATMVFQPAAVQALTAEMDELRKYNNQLPEKDENYPAIFQTLTDSLLYVQKIDAASKLCKYAPASGFYVIRIPKQKFIEVLTVKVKPKPEKGPNW